MRYGSNFEVARICKNGCDSTAVARSTGSKHSLPIASVHKPLSCQHNKEKPVFFAIFFYCHLTKNTAVFKKIFSKTEIQYEDF